MTDKDPRELQFEESPARPRGIASDIARRGDITRRGLIGAGLGVAASAVPTGRAFSAAETESDSNLPPAVPQWQKEPGAPILTPPYGLPSPHEATVVRRPRAGAKPPTDLATYSLTPLQDLHGVITPNGLHYERHHAGVPDIGPEQHRLIIHGLVDRPMIFTMEDLTRFPSVSRFHFLECSGNSSPNWTAPNWTGPNRTRSPAQVAAPRSQAPSVQERGDCSNQQAICTRSAKGCAHSTPAYSDSWIYVCVEFNTRHSADRPVKSAPNARFQPLRLSVVNSKILLNSCSGTAASCIVS